MYKIHKAQPDFNRQATVDFITNYSQQSTYYATKYTYISQFSIRNLSYSYGHIAYKQITCSDHISLHISVCPWLLVLGVAMYYGTNSQFIIYRYIKYEQCSFISQRMHMSKVLFQISLCSLHRLIMDDGFRFCGTIHLK